MTCLPHKKPDGDMFLIANFQYFIHSHSNYNNKGDHTFTALALRVLTSIGILYFTCSVTNLLRFLCCLIIFCSDIVLLGFKYCINNNLITHLTHRKSAVSDLIVCFGPPGNGYQWPPVLRLHGCSSNGDTDHSHGAALHSGSSGWWGFTHSTG